ncbi:MAG: flagellar biosynthetic protein FliO [Alphaproteobacteria bacterium]
MQLTDIAQMIAALAVTLGLFGLGVWGMRRYGPELTKRLASVRADRRLTVLETLILDPKSRLVLVRVDKVERLILIGEGRTIEHASEAPK